MSEAQAIPDNVVDFPDKQALPENLAEFVRGYIACIFFTEAESTFAGEDEHSEDDFDESLQEAIADDCLAFLVKGHVYVDLAITDNNFEYNYQQAGHDFWLTRNGHGAGFWDRGLDIIGAKLTELSKEAGEFSVYLGDDARIYAG